MVGRPGRGGEREGDRQCNYHFGGGRHLILEEGLDFPNGKDEGVAAKRRWLQEGDMESVKRL
eukprot:392174-Amorphochlora_amoeboformis.AAC.1